MASLFIFGMGYSAGYFAAQALKKGWQVQATTRAPTEKQAQCDPQIRLHAYDASAPMDDLSLKLKGVTHILHSIPPHRETGDPVLNHHLKELQQSSDIKWFGYLSTTGVYGNANGQWVDETSPRNPSSARSKARKSAEDGWLNSGLPVHVFRLAGIYGPTRSLFNSIRNGQMRAIDKPGHVFSRIHRDDIAGLLWASMARPQPGQAYNACDDYPQEPYEVLKTACQMIGVTPPPARPFDEVAQDMSPMARTFWNDNKKVDNRKIKQELNYQLIYPDYESGLRAILAEEEKG